MPPPVKEGMVMYNLMEGLDVGDEPFDSLVRNDYNEAYRQSKVAIYSQWAEEFNQNQICVFEGVKFSCCLFFYGSHYTN